MRVEERREQKADQSLFIFRDTTLVHPSGGCARARTGTMWNLPHGEKLGEIWPGSPANIKSISCEILLGCPRSMKHG